MHQVHCREPGPEFCNGTPERHVGSSKKGPFHGVSLDEDLFTREPVQCSREQAGIITWAIVAEFNVILISDWFSRFMEVREA